MSANTERRTRRAAGEPRRLLAAAAREVFATRGYAAASTREIAERADVSETLIFRYFGSKQGLFRETVVQPFADFVDSFALDWESGRFADLDEEALTHAFVGSLYDVFKAHRGLVVMFLHADAHDSSALAEAGVLDVVRAKIEVLVDIGRGEMRRRHAELPRQDLATRATVAMVAGMAAFGPSFYGPRPPSRASIVDELTESILYGRQRRHRPDLPA